MIDKIGGWLWNIFLFFVVVIFAIQLYKMAHRTMYGQDQTLIYGKEFDVYKVCVEGKEYLKFPNAVIESTSVHTKSPKQC